MRRSYGYTPRQNSGWDTTSQDYCAHLSRMERTATIIPDAPKYPNVHKAFNNKYTFEEEEVVGSIGQEEHHRKQQQSPSPKSQKKVMLLDHVQETIEETRDENYETSVDVEADGYIQQKRKGFELSKWKTFKV